MANALIRDPVLTDGIIDAHHHIWRIGDLPWLQAPAQLKIFGDAYQAMQRDYLVDEYLQDAGPHNVVAAVFVQANWPSAKSLDEVAWVQSVADKHGFPQAIVGYVDLSAADRETLIDGELKFPNLRGVRQQVYWHGSNPAYRFGPRSDFMTDSYWRSGMDLLAERGLLFELQVFPEQMHEAAELVRDFPDTQFVLVHAGMIEDTSAKGWQAWRSGMGELANNPNIAVKLSGAGTFVRKNDAPLTMSINREVISMFGAERSLFGSNFPVEKNWTDYAGIVAAARASASHLSAGDQRAIFHDTAKRLYRL